MEKDKATFFNKGKTIEAIKNYDDSYYYLKHGLAQEYSESIFNFLTIKFKILKEWDRLIILEQVTVLNMLSYM